MIRRANQTTDAFDAAFCATNLRVGIGREGPSSIGRQALGHPWLVSRKQTICGECCRVLSLSAGACEVLRNLKMENGLSDIMFLFCHAFDLSALVFL